MADEPVANESVTGDATVPGRLRPVMVGGTGRSGSTIVGHLLDHHPDLTMCRPMEVRFITQRGGVAHALAAGLAAPGSAQASAAATMAVTRLRNRWYRRAETVGLHQSLSSADLDALVDAYLAGFPVDPTAATRSLTYAIMDRVADLLGATRLVDTTPANARYADLLEPVYPDCSVVVVTRDGRDVAASFAQQSFGPDDPIEALAQWEERMLLAHRAALACRPGRVLTVELTDLVVRDRAGTLARLCAFVGVDVDPGMVAWFDENVTSDGMHPGRWRRDLDEDTCRRLGAEYQAACTRLAEQGVALPA